MTELLLDANKRYTYADYLTWLDDKRRELLDGFVRLMSPAPSNKHQDVSLLIGSTLLHLVKKHKGKCKVYVAPFDVRLPKNGEKDDNKIYTVLQPDICVVCDLSKLADDRGCLGAPDLVVEILSKSSIRYDMNDKFRLYEAAGVREYWVAFPYDSKVLVYILQADGKYDNGTTYTKGRMPIHIFDNVEINIDEIFNDI